MTGVVSNHQVQSSNLSLRNFTPYINSYCKILNLVKHRKHSFQFCYNVYCMLAKTLHKNKFYPLF